MQQIGNPLIIDLKHPFDTPVSSKWFCAISWVVKSRIFVLPFFTAKRCNHLTRVLKFQSVSKTWHTKTWHSIFVYSPRTVASLSTASAIMALEPFWQARDYASFYSKRERGHDYLSLLEVQSEGHRTKSVDRANPLCSRQGGFGSDIHWTGESWVAYGFEGLRAGG